MKKLSIIFSLLLAGSAYLSAQNVVSGTVVDHDGNPIPGVKVEIVGGQESVITELDGTFRMETAVPGKKVRVMYAGMQTKTKKIKPDMRIKMRNTSWWNQKPEKYQWFLGVQGAFPEVSNMNPAFGLMAGRVKNIGWYVKGVYAYVPSSEFENDYYYDYYYSDYWHTDKIRKGMYSVTAGGMLRLWSPIYFYLGAGYVSRTVVQDLGEGHYMKRHDYSYDTYAVEAGLMIRYKRFFLNAGFIAGDLFGDPQDPIGNFGVGIFF